MTKTAAAHLRNRTAAGSYQRSHNKRRRISDAARAVLVQLHTRQVAEIHDIARMHHGHRQLGRLLITHSALQNGHHHTRHLIIGNVAFDKSVHHELNFFPA